jgi:hypothetical protein
LGDEPLEALGGTLRDIPRSRWSSSKRVTPTQTSRMMSGDQGSPAISRVRVIE